ncbi:MAG: type VI secretion system baseplate subunit TssG [Rhizobiaceae bacterium]
MFERPQAYELFQAMRIVELIAAEENAASGLPVPETAGRGVDWSRATMRVRSGVPLGFAAAEVVSVRRPKGASPIELIQTAFGLTGPSGALPHAFSELVHLSVRERNPGLRDFLDLFNNRLSGLYFEAWAKHRLTIELERSARLELPQPIDAALRAVIGFGLPSMRERTATDDDTLVHYGGLLSRSARSAQAVEQLLRGATGLPIRIEQFEGRWLPIAKSERSRLPASASPNGSFCRLGEDMVAGERIYDVQSTVRFIIGPVAYSDFRALLPDGAGSRGFGDLAAVALGPEMSFRLTIELRPDELPSLSLEREDHPETGSRLGWNTWLYTDRPRSEPARVDIEPPAHLR